MEYYNPPRLKAGWMGTSRLHRCEDGHWVCFFALDDTRARLLPSEDTGFQIHRDTKRLMWVAIAAMIATLLLILATVGSGGSYGPDNMLASLAAFYTAFLLGAISGCAATSASCRSRNGPTTWKKKSVFQVRWSPGSRSWQ